MSWRSKVVQQREPCGSAGRVRADIVWAPGGLIEAQISHCRDPLLRAGQACASSTPLRAQDLRVTHQRLLHLVLVSSDLRGFVHAHPVHADSEADGPILFNVSVPLGPLAWRLEGAAVPPGCAAAKAADAAATMFALRGTLASRVANSPRDCPGLPPGPHTFPLLPSGRGGATGGGGVDDEATAAATSTGAAGAGGAGAVVLARGRAEGAPLEAGVTCCDAAAAEAAAVGEDGDGDEVGSAVGDASGSAAEGGGCCYRARLFSVGAAVGAGVGVGGAWCETLGVEWRQVRQGAASNRGGRVAPGYTAASPPSPHGTNSNGGALPMRAYLGAAAHLTLAQRVPGGGARVVAHGHLPMPGRSMDLTGMNMPGISTSAAAKPNLGYVYRGSGMRRLHGSSKPRDVPPLWEVGAPEEVCAASRAPLPPRRPLASAAAANASANAAIGVGAPASLGPLWLRVRLEEAGEYRLFVSVAATTPQDAAVTGQPQLQPQLQPVVTFGFWLGVGARGARAQLHSSGAAAAAATARAACAACAANCTAAATAASLRPFVPTADDDDDDDGASEAFCVLAEAVAAGATRAAPPSPPPPPPPCDDSARNCKQQKCNTVYPDSKKKRCKKTCNLC